MSGFLPIRSRAVGKLSKQLRDDAGAGPDHHPAKILCFLKLENKQMPSSKRWFLTISATLYPGTLPYPRVRVPVF